MLAMKHWGWSLGDLTLQILYRGEMFFPPLQINIIIITFNITLQSEVPLSD